VRQIGAMATDKKEDGLWMEGHKAASERERKTESESERERGERREREERDRDRDRERREPHTDPCFFTATSHCSTTSQPCASTPPPHPRLGRTLAPSW
jgi:hypothetical protein